MRSNTKKNEIYEIRLRKVPVNTQKIVLLPRISRPNIHVQNMVSSISAVVEESIIEEPVIGEAIIEKAIIEEPVIGEPVIKCVENNINNLQYIKSKIMTKYGNLYKTKIDTNF